MMKNKKFWKTICVLAIIAYTLKNLLIGTDTDEGYGIMVGYRLAMGDRLLLDMWEPHQTSAIFTALFIGPFVRLTGGVNYLNLFLRVVFFPIQAGVSVFLYKNNQKDCTVGGCVRSCPDGAVVLCDNAKICFYS